MRRSAIAIVLFTVAASLVVGVAPAQADVPVGPAAYAPCPGTTGVDARYRGPFAPYRCHLAVRDPLGDVVILRQGRSNARDSSFGWLHTLFDHNVDDHVVARVVSSSYPRAAPRGRCRYSAEFRVHGQGVMTVWMEIDRKPSRDTSDPEQLGVLTAYCKLPHRSDPDNKCPDWVNDSLLPE